MESPSASPSGREKRKRTKDDDDEETAKRLKVAQESDVVTHRLPRSPRISVALDRLQRPITAKELTELLHYAALGKTGGAKQPSWCRLHHQKKVRGLNVVVVDGLTQGHFYKHYLALPHLRTSYSSRITFDPSCQNVANEIFSGDVAESDDPSFCARVQNTNGELPKALKFHPVIMAFGTQRRGLTAYVLSEADMIKKNYPVKGMPGFEEFVCTDCADGVSDSSPLFGLDCEMCLTEKGNELTRVSLVDSQGNCVLDELVKPPNRILNYLTKFSGITAKMLRPISTSLRAVRAKLTALLPRDAVLVGHSVNNDLTALKLIHRHVIDSALLYRKEFGHKFKLKVLAETVLKRQIQTEEKVGHDPTEDAGAALQLVQYFIKEGPLQVVQTHLQELWGYSMEEEEEKGEEPTDSPAQSHRFSDVLQTLGRSVAFVGRRSDDVALDLSSQLWHNSDKEVLSSFRTQTKTPFLSVLQFPSFSDHLKKCGPHPERHNLRVRASLRDLCVVLAGPLPAGFCERQVKRLFRRCGAVREVRMLNTSVRLHAAVEFELLEGAATALDTLNGFHLQGGSIKVQRPVHESTLDLDLTLEALTRDPLNASSIYAVQSGLGEEERRNGSAKINGHAVGTGSVGTGSVGTGSEAETSLKRSWAESEEENIRATFGRFGVVERIVGPGRKRARHFHIKFESPEGKRAAVGSSEDLRALGYVVRPSLTPPHLCSWVPMATSTLETTGDNTHMHITSQDQETALVMAKLDRSLGKLFRSLPECTLSVVLLPGHDSAEGHFPGLCFLEVTSGSNGGE